MKICTFNIWNADTNFNKRLELLVKEISNHSIDILALQEVKNETTFNHIKTKTEFEYGFYYEGLAFLSNYEIKEYEKSNKDNNFILRVVYKDSSFTNVHLDWKNKETRVIGIDTYYDMLEKNAFENEFLLGDFNNIPEDQLHFDLVMSDYTDIHQTYSHSINELPLPTLDMDNNPRWRNHKTDEVPCRFDWIMLNTIKDFNINEVKLVGTEEVNGITPSDHYGIISDIDIDL